MNVHGPPVMGNINELHRHSHERSKIVLHGLPDDGDKHVHGKFGNGAGARFAQVI